ncbi:hypothetical protein [Nonomuraea sp. NPDC050310]|uniref:hypothetical protein n=1 Tax=unclassified Nonomuraea TaxID=2593643 RepID=UPI0033F50B18
MQQLRQPWWADAVGPQEAAGPLHEGAEGRVYLGLAPVTATPAVVTIAGAMVVAYAAGALVGETPRQPG